MSKSRPRPQFARTSCGRRVSVSRENAFRVRDDGGHEHCLTAEKNKDGLLDILQDRLTVARGISKQVEKHIAITPDPQSVPESSASSTSEASTSSTSSTSSTLVDRYGTYEELIGRGSSGVVRISHTPSSKEYPTGQLFAVKKFEQRPQESSKKYLKRLAAEFCISSTLRHPNVVYTLDLVQDTDTSFCVIMEYCAGGDLYSRIRTADKLSSKEANCFFKQLMCGIQYIHETGVAHRDLKPDNLLLTVRGTLKIADFGNAECFRLPWEGKCRQTTGLCGSFPYISPEQYSDHEFDASSADIWSAGVIYMDMRTGRHMWHFAVASKDYGYREYLRDRKEAGVYDPIEELTGVREPGHLKTFSRFLVVSDIFWKLESRTLVGM